MTVRVRGHLDHATTPDLEHALRVAIGHAHHVVVDLKAVGELDAFGIRALLATQHAAADADVKFHVRSTSPIARARLVTAGAAHLLTPPN